MQLPLLFAIAGWCSTCRKPVRASTEGVNLLNGARIPEFHWRKNSPVNSSICVGEFMTEQPP